MSSNSATNTRVTIPSGVRKTIRSIKEIGVNHSDEDVYAVLKECSMDPDETVQRLLFLDTFHEVKRKRDKRKENVNGKVSEDMRRKPSNQGWGARNGRRSFSSQYASHDAGGGRNAAVHKQNGLDDGTQKALKAPDLLVPKEVDSRASTFMEKTSPVTGNGPSELPNDGANIGQVVQNSEIDTVLQKDDTYAGPIKREIAVPQAKVNTEHAPSASDPLLVPLQFCDSQLLTSVRAIKHVVRKESSDSVEIVQPETNGETLFCEKLSSAPVPDNASAVNSSLMNDIGSTKAIEESTLKLEKLKFSEGQHVILPNHIQVPDAVKSVISFGSLDSCFGGINDIASSESNRNSRQASEELLEDEIANEPESCDEDTPSSAQEVNYPDPPPAPLAETISPPEDEVLIPKDDQVKQETRPVVGPPYPVVQTPTYGFGFMPPMLGSPLIQIEGHYHQHEARLSNSMNGSSSAMSTPTPMPLPTQSAGVVPSSIVVSVQPVPLLRQPYSPNFIPHTHYLSPFFVPPTLQFVGHGGFPPQLPADNIYMPPATAPGTKTPPHKTGSNVANQAPVMMPPSGAYGVYGSQVGYKPSTAVASGANEELAPSALKENSVYIGQQSEGSTVWVPVPGRDTTTLSVNSLFNLPYSGHGAFAAMNHPLQTAAAHPLLQQPQSMAGAESVGLPPPLPHAFQQSPQFHQINWNSSF